MPDQGDNENPRAVVLKKRELQNFTSLADSTLHRAELLLSDHFHGRINLAAPLLSRVCELYATGAIFAEYMENNFDTEALPEGSTLEVPINYVQVMAKIILSISECKTYLSENSICLDRNNDI